MSQEALPVRKNARGSITQNIKETSDTLRGPKVNARKHWDGESWILEDAKTRKPLLIGTSSQILDEYDRRNKSL